MNDALFSQASWEEGEMDACLNLCASAELLHDLVQGIVSALEARDPHTAEHSLRVGDMVEQTCLAMGLPAEQVMTIHMAAHVHDIGKIAIDEKILNKPGRLTPEEFEVIKTHTTIGADMLSKLDNFCVEPLLQTAYSIARWHHERWDGRGYPDGLKENEIPIEAQVVALADVYDALTSDRCYKKACPHEQAVEMILNGECGAFNPMLLECFVEIEGDLKRELEEERRSKA